MALPNLSPNTSDPQLVGEVSDTNTQQESQCGAESHIQSDYTKSLKDIFTLQFIEIADLRLYTLLYKPNQQAINKRENG